MISEAGDFASCDAVLIKRRLSRLSARSALANSCCTQSVALVPGSTPFGSCSRRALFGTLLDASRHMMRRVQSYQTKIIVSSDCLVRRAQRVPGLDFVCNRKYRCCLTIADRMPHSCRWRRTATGRKGEFAWSVLPWGGRPDGAARLYKIFAEMRPFAYSYSSVLKCIAHRRRSAGRRLVPTLRRILCSDQCVRTSRR